SSRSRTEPGSDSAMYATNVGSPAAKRAISRSWAVRWRSKRSRADAEAASDSRTDWSATWLARSAVNPRAASTTPRTRAPHSRKSRAPSERASRLVIAFIAAFVTVGLPELVEMDRDHRHGRLERHLEVAGAGQLDLARPGLGARVPDAQRAAPGREPAQLEASVGAGDDGERRLQHHDERRHLAVDVAEDAHQPGAREPHRLARPRADQAQVEAIAGRDREDVVPDRVLVREPRLAPDRHDDDAGLETAV